MSKSENGAIVGQILKGLVGFVGAVAVAIFSGKKVKEKYKDSENKTKPGK